MVFGCESSYKQRIHTSHQHIEIFQKIPFQRIHQCGVDELGKSSGTKAFFVYIHQECIDGGIDEADQAGCVVIDLFATGVLGELEERLDDFGRDPNGLRVGHAEHLHAHHFKIVIILHDPPVHGIEDLIVEGFHGVS